MKKLIIITLFIFIAYNSFGMTVISPYVSVNFLKNHLGKVVLLDIRKSKNDFYRGHIPGATFVNTSEIRIDKVINGKTLEGFLPDKDYFENFLRKLGINNNSTVVIYTTRRKQIRYPARLYWQLKAYGFNNIAILDGGYHKWLDVVKKNEKGPGEVVKRGNVVLDKLNKRYLATIDDVKKALDDKNSILIDFREIPYYLGVKKKNYLPEAGHIPGALILSEDVFFNDDGTFIDKNSMEKTLTAFNIPLNKPMIIYCNTGNHAALGWFILHELLKLKNVKNYDGSLIEWTANKLPLKTYFIENF